MKLKRKILLSTSTIIAVLAPVIFTISCSEKDKTDWNDTDSNISGSSSAIDIDLNKELVFEGKDRAGTLQFQFKRGVIPMLSQANAKLVVEIARYKKSTILEDNYEKVLAVEFSKWNKEEKITTNKKDFINKGLASINDLMVEDKVRVTVSTPMKGYEIKGIVPLVISSEKLEYEPLKPSEKLINLAKVAIVKNTLRVNLNKYEKNNLNDVIFSIASGIGILLSDKTDVTLVNDDCLKKFTPIMLFEMIKRIKKRNVERIEFAYTDKEGKVRTSIFSLDQLGLIDSDSNNEIRKDKTITEKINHAFEELDKIFNPITTKTIRHKIEDTNSKDKPKDQAKDWPKDKDEIVESKIDIENKIKENVDDIQREIHDRNIMNQYLSVFEIADKINQIIPYQKEIFDLNEQKKNPSLTKDEIANIDKNIQNIQNELKQNSVNFKYEKIQEKLLSLANWANIYLPKINEGTEITGIFAVAKFDDTITIEIKTTSEENKKGYVYGLLIGKEVHKLIKDQNESYGDFKIRQEDQQKHLEELKWKIENREQITPNIWKFKDLVSKLKIKDDNMTKLAVIASEINAINGTIDDKLAALNKWGNTSIPKKINGTEITNIISTEDPSTGTIYINIKTTSKDSQQKDNVVDIFGIMAGKTNQQIDDIQQANVQQMININKINDELENKTIENQGFKYLDSIVDKINKIDNLSKKIKEINSITGSNLKLVENNTKITKIKVESKKDGEIKLIVSTNTLGALVPTNDKEIIIWGESNEVVAKNIIEEINETNTTIADQIDAIKSIMDIVIPKQQDGGKVVKIAAKLDDKEEVVIDVSEKASKEINPSDSIGKVADKIKRLLLNSKLQERYKEILEPLDNDLLLFAANIWDEENSSTEALESLIDLAITYSDIFKRLKEWEFFQDWVEQTRMRNIDKIDTILIATILRK